MLLLFGLVLLLEALFCPLPAVPPLGVPPAAANNTSQPCALPPPPPPSLPGTAPARPCPAPSIHELVKTPYFRLYQARTEPHCMLGWDDHFCSSPDCSVEVACPPPGLELAPAPALQHGFGGSAAARAEQCRDELRGMQGLNTNLTALELGVARGIDESPLSFCSLDTDAAAASPDWAYVNLLENPERFTGYSGDASHRVWRAIYEENCFSPGAAPDAASSSPVAAPQPCLELDFFQRLVSGIHSSISLHLCYHYREYGQWFANLDEFERRFEAHPEWLENLALARRVVARALLKARPLWQRYTFYTGSAQADAQAKAQVLAFVERLAAEHDCHAAAGANMNAMATASSASGSTAEPLFFETAAWLEGTLPRAAMRQQLRHRFRNITRIMECVGCDKCRLWGKLQFQGAATALRLLLQDPPGLEATDTEPEPAAWLHRNEVVALFNLYQRLTASLEYLRDFRQMQDARAAGIAPFRPEPALEWLVGSSDLDGAGF